MCAISPVYWVLGLSMEEASFRKRGFIERDPSKRAALESIGQTFIGGYNAVILARGIDDILHHLEIVPPVRRGFAAEGAAMAHAVTDALPFRKPRFAEYIGALESEFSYLTHVGAGWALARIPWRRSRILASLDPVHHWLAYDGMGFHDTYFHHRRVLAGWQRRSSTYAAHAYDQGVGRALWFVAGGSVADVAELISGFAASRHSDLWSGLGLAMTYAGLADDHEIRTTLGAAGAHRMHFAQGVAFACEARALARHIPGHTELAARSVTGAGAKELSNLVRDARANLSRGDADAPPYEMWRRKVMAAMSPMLERRA